MPALSYFRTAVHGALDHFGFRLVRKEQSNLKWFYPVPVNCEIPSAPYIFEHFFGRRESGTYVEVGAFDGYNFSNTFGLAVRGWDGYLIEPDPQSYALCVARYASMPKIVVSECAISDGSVDHIELIRGGPTTTASAKQAAEYRVTPYFRDAITDERVSVEAVTLDAYLEREKVPEGFDLLVVDVEGTTPDVFAGFDIGRWMPKMLITELFDLHPTFGGSRRSDMQLRRAILGAGYETIYKDSINTIFVQSNILDSEVDD
jgi:FkbM family methyltransferase